MQECQENIKSEFDECNFNDQRLNKRIVALANDLFKRPSSIIYGTFSNNANKKSAYNFFKNVKVQTKKIQEPHFRNSTKKIEETEDDILLIQDTTYCHLNLKSPFKDQKTYLGKTKQGDLLQGFAMHSTLAIKANGLPIGLVNQQIYQHSEDDDEKQNVPIEEKESFRWLEAVKYTNKNISNDRVIHICDREGDIFELLSYAYKNDNKFIIRLAQDRRTGTNNRKSEGRIKERLDKLNSVYEIETDIYDQKTSKYVNRKLGIKTIELLLPKPQNKVFRNDSDYDKIIKVNVLEVKTIDDMEEVSWILITNLQVSNQEESIKIIKYYKLRWHIESYHKVLKSGFGIEEARLESIAGLQNLFALLSILAVKLYYLIHLGRIDTEKSCEEILEKHEWQSLLIQSKKAKITDQDMKTPTIKEAVTMIAQLGGYMNRKKDSPPGIIVIWRGWLRLSEIAAYHKLIYNSIKTYG
jgi:hypothetical protein